MRPNKIEDRRDKINEIKNQKRSVRIATIIGIIAIFAGIATVLCKILLKFTNTWTTNGAVYFLCEGLALITFASLLLIVMRASMFCLYDLKRQDVMNENSTRYDFKSDKAYHDCICCAEFYTKCIVIIFVTNLIIIIITEKWRVEYIIPLIGSLIIIGALGIWYWSEKGRTKQWKQRGISYLKKLGNGCKKNSENIICLIIVSIIVLFSSWIFQFRMKAVILVDYGIDGNVRMELQTQDDDASIEVKIYDENKEKIDIQDRGKIHKIMKAYESSSIFMTRENGNIYAGASYIDQQKVYLVAEDDLTSVIKNDGTYYVETIFKINNATISVCNNVEKKQGVFSYAKQHIKKEI